MAGLPGILGAAFGRRSTRCSGFCARSAFYAGVDERRLDRRARFEIASARHPVEHVAPFVPQS